MKKTNFFKIVMTLVMAFVVNGAFAQLTWVDSLDVNEGIDTVTVGATVPYYVEPDQYFNPSTTAVKDTADVTSTFSWDLSRFAGSLTPDWQSNTNVGGDNAGNYVEITFDATNAAGEYIYVTETSDAGTCPGDPVSLEVRVINEPSIAYTGTADEFIGANVEFCDGADEADDVVRVELSSDIAGSPSFRLEYSYRVDTVEAGGGSTAQVGTTTTYTGASAIDTDAANYTLNDHAGTFATITNPSGNQVTTIYTYTLLGVNDRISRKSDALDNPTLADASWTLYDNAPDILVITVNPAPVTGPIYHISNMWAN